MTTKHIVQLQTNDRGEQYVEFDPELMQELCWRVGDVLRWVVDNHSVIVYNQAATQRRRFRERLQVQHRRFDVSQSQ